MHFDPYITRLVIGIMAIAVGIVCTASAFEEMGTPLVSKQSRTGRLALAVCQWATFVGMLSSANRGFPITYGTFAVFASVICSALFAASWLWWIRKKIRLVRDGFNPWTREPIPVIPEFKIDVNLPNIPNI